VLVACHGSEKPPLGGSKPDDKKVNPISPGNGATGSGSDLFAVPRDAGLAQDIQQMITPGDLTATGDVDKDAVRHVVKQNLQKLQLCYEKTLLANPGISGKVVVSFTIGIEGSVSDVTATGIHPDVETCVATEFRTFKFPAPSSKTQVEYPFTFRPG
jgi:hypothetical protein